MPTKSLYWLSFALFVTVALYFNWHNLHIRPSDPLAGGKYVVWFTFAAFVAYSIYCSSRENLFESVKKIAQLHWGRQVGIDLYVGVALTLFIVYLNEGSGLSVLLWLGPALAFANLATLLYFAVHYDSIVAGFLV